MNALDTIGDTPIVELRRVVEPGMARILVKIEGANPTGSKKDRMAREAILTAERDGRLKPGQPVVEYTGGSTGSSLAFVCAATGHPIFIVSSDAFSREKLDHMAALGAKMEVVKSDNGKLNEALFRAMIKRASEIAIEKGAFWTDQLNNIDAARGYHSLGHELWVQSGGGVDAYVESVGTAHSITGVSRVLREKNTKVQITAVEPEESPVLSQGKSGAHRIEGIGIGFVPPMWDPTVVDGFDTVSSSDAMAMARRLAKEEGIFAGTSSGANVVAALRIAERLGTGKTVTTISVDHGMKYLSTELYREN